MRDFAHRLIDFGWSLPLLGARGSAEGDEPMGAGLAHTLTFGARTVEGMADLARTFLCPDLYTPKSLMETGASALERAAEGTRLALTGSGPAWAALEMVNKGEVFVLVRQVALLLDEPATAPLPLLKLVDRAYALGPFPALWAVEGLGHDYAQSVWRQSGAPRGLLADSGVAGLLPQKSLLMLHAGMGLFFADQFLPKALGTSRQEVRRAVIEIVELCRANARPGYLGPALESLGLVSRLFRCAAIVPEVDRALAEVAPEVRGFFWHGVGRALYFLPQNFLPCSTWRVFLMAGREAPDDEARANLFAGAAWAEALVNQRQAEILWQLVIRPHGEELATGIARAGFENGLAAALAMRHETTPDAPFERPFLNFRPSDGTARERALWQELVASPGTEGVEIAAPTLRAENRLGELFHFGPLPGVGHGGAGGAA